MPDSIMLSRRALLRAAAATTAGFAVPSLLSAGRANAGTAVTAFVDDYRTNVAANQSVETNAAARILDGFQRIWRTGSAWDDGTVLDPATLHRSMEYVIRVTKHRTAAEAADAFVHDRQNQSYAAIAGLGPLAPVYKAGSLAVTGITSAPEGTPPTTIDDTVPADAPPGSALGAGSATSALGQVVTLVNTLRGPFSSSNPAKLTYDYPRPWRMTRTSTVVDTGRADPFGFPVYDSDVVVAPQLLRQRSLSPAEDGGFPSGHTNAFHLAALALAYAIPERMQELVTAAFALSESRIVAGMHSPVDVIGGRILATALAAAILNDPANAGLKSRARRQAERYLRSQVGADLYGYAHSATTLTDPYADRAANRRLVEPKLTYDLPRRRSTATMTVPEGAEALLETRQPYLSAGQRREVLRTTALGAGYPLLDGPENWGRLDLFRAADGYGSFDRDTRVSLDAAAGGFAAADTWRNDIDGRGGLIKSGTGSLTLTGDNSYRGGTTLVGGTLVAGSATALGGGDVVLAGGSLRVADDLRVGGEYRQSASTLAVTDHTVTVRGDAVLGRDSVLAVDGRPGRDVVVLRARRVSGRFSRVLTSPKHRATITYTRTTVTAHLTED
nr:phosphatase PAP2 family protein [uncultured Actinoplanes sp.]